MFSSQASHKHSGRVACLVHGGGERGAVFQPEAERVRGFKESDAPKEKTRPGGQPDGSSHMGAWGGWALAPNMTYGEG